MTELEPISPGRPLLSDAVAQNLTRQIIGRAMMPGDALPSESDIGRQLGVSKPVVREAIRKLSALGMVEIRQGKPSTVGQLAPEPVRQMLQFAMHINPEGLREAVELRRVLETHAAISAAEHVTQEDVARLSATVDRMERCLADHDGMVAADVEFHQLLAHLSRNSLIAFLVDALSDLMREMISTLFGETKGRDRGVIDRHRALVDAIAAHDAAATAKAMDVHFAASMPTVDLVLAARARKSGR